MLNHSSVPAARSTTLNLIRTPLSVETEGRMFTLDACSSLKASPVVRRPHVRGWPCVCVWYVGVCVWWVLTHAGTTQPPRWRETDRAIAAGKEVLHRYGELSDCQLRGVFAIVVLHWPEGQSKPHNYAWLPRRGWPRSRASRV